jgi:hypothetical protein
MFNLASKYCFYLDSDLSKNLELFLLLYNLEKYVNGATIEMHRIERTRSNIDKKLLDMAKNGTFKKSNFSLTFLSCDTHFYFICIDKCYKLIRQLSLELDDQEIKTLKTRLDKVFDITTIRNHFEHIEDRCRGYLNKKDKKKKIKKDINDFGNFIGDDFSFNNKMYPINKGSLKELKRIYLDLIAIIDKKARKNPKFVERTDAEKVSRLIMKKVKKMGIARD